MTGLFQWVPTWVEPGEVIRAWSVAADLHMHQADKSGEPYIVHVATVACLAAHTARAFGLPPEEAMVTGLLHDSVEDTEATVDDIRFLFGDRVAAHVDRLTHRGERRDDYLRAMADDPVAVVVKIADNAHNSLPSRLSGLPADTADRLHRKYHADRETLAGIAPFHMIDGEPPANPSIIGFLPGGYDRVPGDGETVYGNSGKVSFNGTWEPFEDLYVAGLVVEAWRGRLR